MRMSRNVIWTPTDKQREMLCKGEDEGFYGGAAGGGKSDYLVVQGLSQVEIPHYRGLILRKTTPELKDLIDKSYSIYKKIYPKAKFNETKHTWTFPSGAKVQFGSLFRTQDKHKYQGLQYDFIGFDELTHFTWEEYSYLLSRNRAGGAGTKVFMRCTGNPGGIGMGWVKKYFVEAGTPGKTIWDKYKYITPTGELKKIWKSKIFVQSSVFDNKHLLENDPMYIHRLASLSENDKNALLYGLWDSFEGQVFTEWRDDVEHYEDRVFTHVIHPFRIPPNWKIIRSFDWGYTKPFSVGWSAVDNDGRYYRIQELYGCSDTPNTGVKMNPQEIARRILEIENTDINLKGKYIYGVADPAIFEESNGNSIAVQFEKCGVFWNKADNSRIAGKMQYHYRFSFDENGIPMLYIFSNCREFIRTIPNLIYSERKVEDVDTDTEDHIYDEMRYALQENVINPRVNVLTVPQGYDPLDIQRSKHRKEDYYFYRM